MSIMGVWVDSRRLSPEEFHAKYFVSLKHEMDRPLTPDERRWLAEREDEARRRDRTGS